jgi:hypothetical protein
VAAFMEVLDTSIANVALPYMAGNLGASNDESTWVFASYLESNAIVLPISGWLAGALGRKRFFLIRIAMFTVSSLMCGFAPSLGFLLFFRVLQGGRGRPSADVAIDSGGQLSARKEGFSLFHLWHHHGRCAHDWTDPGRLRADPAIRSVSTQCPRYSGCRRLFLIPECPSAGLHIGLH